MTNLHILSLSYFIFLSWAKGGLADDWSRDVRIFLSLIILILFLIKKFKFILSQKLSFFPILFSAGFFLVCSLNLNSDKLDAQLLKELDYKERVDQCNSLSKARVITEAIRMVENTTRIDPSKGLTLFLDFKNRYEDKFDPPKDDDLWLLINQIEKKITNKRFNFLPSSINLNFDDYLEFYFLLFHIVLGYIFYSITSRNPRLLETTCIVLFINCALLAIIGIVQKIYYVPNDHALEILGIWNTPEPRYYFSTFTYKNHWSTFCLCSFLIGICVCVNKWRFLGQDAKRSPLFLGTLLLNLPILASIPYSGSRSGCILLAIILIIFLVRYFFRFKKYELQKSLLLFSIIITSSMAIILFSFSKSSTYLEMKKNSLTQIENALNGKPPLRISIWKDTITQIRDKPWLGHGYKGFQTFNPKYQSDIVRFERSKGLANAHRPYIPLVAHAHNDVLEWICDYGLIGFFIIILPFVVTHFSLAFLVKSTSLNLLLLSSLPVYIMSVIDFPTRTPACLALFSIIIGLTLGYFSNRIKNWI